MLREGTQSASQLNRGQSRPSIFREAFANRNHERQIDRVDT